MDFLAHLRADGARFSGLARDGDPQADVPCCPDWRLRDLVAHLGGVHRYITSRVAAGTDEYRDLPRPQVPDGDLAGWYDEGLARLLDVLERTAPDAPVWNWSAHEPKTAAFWLRRMAQETAVHRYITSRVSAGTDEWRDLPRPPAPDGDLAGWYDEGLARLLDVLERTPPDAPVWNWSAHEPKTAAFWPRRMAQETAVHRWDAESAVGDLTPIDPALAADGIDEGLAVHLDSDAADPDEPEPPAGLGSLHLHCTDVAGEWWAVLAGRHLTVRREHAKGDVAARGRAEDLLLVCWRRRPPSAVDVVGDPTVLDAWLALASN